MKLNIVRLFLITYALYFVAHYFHLGFISKVNHSFPIFEIFGLFFDSLPNQVHIFLLGLGAVFFILTLFKVFRRVSSIIMKVLGYSIAFLFLVFMFFIGKFLYENPTIANLIYEYVFKKQKELLDKAEL